MDTARCTQIVVVRVARVIFVLLVRGTESCTVFMLRVKVKGHARSLVLVSSLVFIIEDLGGRNGKLFLPRFVVVVC